jgi:hypothetical protein
MRVVGTITSIALIITLQACANFVTRVYPEVTGHISNNGSPVPEAQVSLLLRNVEFSESPKPDICGKPTVSTKTDKNGDFSFSQRSKSTMVSIFNFDSSSDRALQEHRISFCLGPESHGGQLLLIAVGGQTLSSVFTGAISLNCDISRPDEKCTLGQQNGNLFHAQ